MLKTIIFVIMNLTKATFILFVVLITSLTLKAQERRFHHFTTTEGLSYNTVYDIAQDRDGFLWIATAEGLNRYDSYGFRPYYSDTTSASLPSNDVTALLASRQGKLFVGTSKGLCLFNPELGQFKPIFYEDKPLGIIRDLFESRKGLILVCSTTGVYRLGETGDVQSRLPLENDMLQVQEDTAGTLWTFKRQRLFHFDEQGNILDVFYVRPAIGPPLFLPSPISTIKADARGQIWVGTFQYGPMILDIRKKVFNPIPLTTPVTTPHPIFFVRTIAEDQEGKYWFGTENGLFIYDREAKTFEHYSQSFDPTLFPINDNAIYKIFRSRENMMWLGTYFGGLNVTEPLKTGFKKILPGTKPNELKGKALSQIMKGPDGKLWIATEDAGIAIWDQQKRTFTYVLRNPIQQRSRTTSNVHSLTIDQNGIVWCGNFFGGINRIDPATLKITNYSRVNGDPASLVNNFVFSLYTDPDDRLWVGTMDGVDCFDKKKERFFRFKPESLRGKFIYDIFQDPQNNYWFCTYNDGLFCYDKEHDKLVCYQKDSTENLPANSFISHHIDSKGNLWFGSRGGGLVFFDRQSRKFRTYDMDDGLPNNVIYGILEDDQHNLWLSSNKGISKFNPETGDIRNFTVEHGLVGTQFNFRSYFKDTDGTMYFGAVNGLTYFHPDQVKSYASEPKVHFTNFRLFNKPVNPGKKSVLQKNIDLTEQITLKYNQNVISFDFIALDYLSGGKNNFYYYMEGFETSWQQAGHQQSATYTNLSAGDYVFHVKATNLYDHPNPNERIVRIRVLPPLWKTSWAYLIYFLLISGVVLLLYRFNEIRHKEKMVLKIEKIEKEKLQELHQHKMNFFTYISHEFKTPLTIILASLDSFFSGDHLPSAFTGQIITIKRNVLRLQFLINQLMDFRKIETDHATINLQQGDVVNFLRELFNAFSTLFKRKELEYVFIAGQESLTIPFDPDKVEKIVSNLLSNAFKYTPEHGVITLKVESVRENDESWLTITISDTGPGMTEEQLTKVFNLFYKIDQDQNDYQGSGVGLTLTQSLVRFLNGKITVESQPGEGTSFTVRLPYEESALPVTPAPIPLSNTVLNDLLEQSALRGEDRMAGNEKSAFEILFVEDNKDLLKFLSDHFKRKYRVTQAANGLEALQSIVKSIPDLIITDLMMPQMDGISLCKQLKTGFDYCHIPIIMLTAKTDMETRLDSLEVGADIYMPKPFLLSELELHIRNILASKANLKKHFIRFGNLDVEQPIRNKDQQFIGKATAIILRHLDNADFGVTMLTKELGVGRTLLHTKLKQILDLSATEFINTIRIREAQKIILEKPELTMSEVAWEVGFNDPNYFSRTFKKIINVSPTDFRAGSCREQTQDSR